MGGNDCLRETIKPSASVVVNRIDCSHKANSTENIMNKPDKLLLQAERLSFYIYTRLMQSIPGSEESNRFRRVARLASKREMRRWHQHQSGSFAVLD